MQSVLLQLLPCSSAARARRRARTLATLSLLSLASAALAQQTSPQRPRVLTGEALHDRGSASSSPSRTGDPASNAPAAASQGAEPMVAATVAAIAESIRPQDDEPQRTAALKALRLATFPQAMSESQVDWWGVQLGLDADAIASLRDLAAVHRADIAGRLGVDLDDRDAVLESVHEWQPEAGRFVERHTPQLIALFSMRQAWVAAHRRGEERFFDGLLSLVAPEKQSQARWLILGRTHELLSRPAVSRTASVNLIPVVLDSKLDGEQMALVTDLLDDYARKMTPVIQWRFELLGKLDVEEATARIELGPGWELVTTSTEREVIEGDLRMLRNQAIRTERPLRDINRATLLAVVRRLPTAAAERVQELFWREVRPESFDDERQLAELVAASLVPGDGVAALDVAEATSRRNLLQGARVRLLPLGFEAVECGDLITVLDDSGPVEAAERATLEIRRFELARQRRGICDETANGLAAMLDSRESTLYARVQEYRRLLEWRGRADAWLASRWTSRLNEIRSLPSPDLPVETQAVDGDGTAAPVSPDGAAAPER